MVVTSLNEIQVPLNLLSVCAWNGLQQKIVLYYSILWYKDLAPVTIYCLVLYSLIWTIAFTSTNMSRGRVLVPMALQAWYPTGLPMTSIIVRILTNHWCTYKFILLGSFEESNCCSSPHFYGIVLWNQWHNTQFLVHSLGQSNSTYSLFHKPNDSPIFQYVAYANDFEYSSLSYSCSYVSSYLLVHICTHIGNWNIYAVCRGATYYSIYLTPFHWWNYSCFQHCLINDIAVPRWMGLVHNNMWARHLPPKTEQLTGTQDRQSKPNVWLAQV